ncbi:MAG: glycosyltransferase [Microgenomates group bacterium GW2011_GWC1_37_8]|uniref:Glycosyltransferase n=1 Tax=Candidatus Woesebacteria bacterium GW2011_GWB1_38_8 TaxID=1618570 RepID=A0A0G0L2M0_9BACT|nr:MAG: glycosyltransferase [Microgenomates group bacterium GW2011_GWC1_37_8]KKQ86213.1 MAG: glycosyltransferase [Candidatus Woesebacteria bacterium GW2011_GWB1_38_8]
MKEKDKKIKISVIIIAKNEEEKIGGCLKSVEWVDEVIVINNESTDRTEEIAKKYGARVINYENGTYSSRKNKGAKEAKGKWLLYIDADERVTPDLRKEINSLITNYESQTTEYSAYAIPRRNIILGKEMKHGGWRPDYVKHLLRKDALIGWKGELHEEPIFKGELAHLKGALLHLKYDNLSDIVTKTNDWSEIEAKLMFEANHPPMNIPRFFTAMGREFWLRMIRQMAFLDGVEGIIYAIYQVYSRFISYAKLWEMQIRDKKYEIRNT